MDNASGHTINLANSIIGVSILAMPYCFKQCGVLLSIFLLLISSIITRLSCHYLLKSAIIARRKTFEILAFHVFGSLGKFCIEIGMIGFLVGTCIAFFVVMGDLGPAIISEVSGVRVGSALRNSTLVALAVFCVLPLGLLRNVHSLNGVSRATLGFYCCLVLKIVIEALPHIFTGDWVSEVILWRPSGILQCLPIFSMALSCQTQLFEIYQVIPNASLDKMNNVIKTAVNMCTWVYIFVGAFGYIAFFQKPFTGNILLSFRTSTISDAIKIGFVLSLAFSFPLVIFPCRASLFSLLYKRTTYTNLHDASVASNFIPEGKFKMLTLVIISISLVIAILIPSIELVLGIIGSTIGVMICVIFPVTCFICISPKNTNERIVAQIMLFVGVIVMVLGSYVNLYAIEEAQLNPITEKLPPLQLELRPNLGEIPNPVAVDIPTTIKNALSEDKLEEMKKKEDIKEVRHEPPQPEEPVEAPAASPAPKVEDKAKRKESENKQEPAVEVQQPVIEKEEDKNDKQGPVVEPVQPLDNKKEAEETKKNKVGEVQIVEGKKIEKRIEEVDIEAIKKEEKELEEDEKKKQKDQNQILIDTIQKQSEVQKEIVKQQKKLLEVIQKQQESVNKKDVDIVNEEKVKAVKQIEDIARKAIESISGQDKKVVKEETTESNKEKGSKAVEIKADQNVAAIAKNELTDKKLNMEIPIPIALAKINNITIGGEEKNTTVKKNNENHVENKALVRDILSEDETVKKRAKRETSEDELENFNKAVKEVCNEVTKITSTEKPIIKMLCKLSEPNVVELSKLGNVERQNLRDLDAGKTN